MNVNAQQAFYIAFGGPGVVEGLPVLTTLRGLIEVAESTVQPLIRPLIAD